jgi:hypothetical protein
MTPGLVAMKSKRVHGEPLTILKKLPYVVSDWIIINDLYFPSRQTLQPVAVKNWSVLAL